MQINFTGHGIEVTDALRTHTHDKLQKILRHFDKIMSIQVTFSVQNLQQVAEATMQIPQHTFHAKHSADDMYEATNMMIHKLDHQLVDYKNKIQNHRE
jgi:putative sigma-54 modulation protein